MAVLLLPAQSEWAGLAPSRLPLRKAAFPHMSAPF